MDMPSGAAFKHSDLSSHQVQQLLLFKCFAWMLRGQEQLDAAPENHVSIVFMDRV
jgi:hypothetical protein